MLLLLLIEVIFSESTRAFPVSISADNLIIHSFIQNYPDMLEKTFELIDKFQPVAIHIPIDKNKMEEVVETLYSQMFPFDEKLKIGEIHYKLKKCVMDLIASVAKLTGQEFAETAIYRFFNSLSKIRDRLYKDAACYLKNDPAAKSIEEVIIAYPGFFALAVHRIAHELCQLEVPLIPRIFAEYAHAKVGIDIHPAAKIGKNLFMDHGTGIVIGETSVIGDNVKIYQGVTLGALYVEKKLSNTKRHPTIENDVVIYSNATILGGDTVVGHNSTIGGGAWITHSVIPYSLVYNSVDVKIKTVKSFVQPNDFII